MSGVWIVANSAWKGAVPDLDEIPFDHAKARGQARASCYFNR